MIAPLVSAVAALAAVGVSYVNHRRIGEVHVLVNAQLEKVMVRLDTVTGERDSLQAARDAQGAPE